mmetsp:Transcript_18826/g.31524  ORF Transcript_18826/g.31524 Transcript_18826/m.31524 type:complete len:323 (-) Transcript_18826:294-1262(-)|eukprot:CAMPEP_0174965420 /NCGR_PEP_ID=MMETSP0004_2-20121128/6424_1 /TAXON_ID=420556 /ORGANISM="Ochromonas sp., Strain CCMP1393" /LENGTH=322 /DNA_ID=CAMNT_0016214251 /DNA_START=175 /DNA_END=1143 /DNA_ORIENTATION=-
MIQIIHGNLSFLALSLTALNLLFIGAFSAEIKDLVGIVKSNYNLSTVQGWEELMFKSEYSTIYGNRAESLNYSRMPAQQSDLKVKIINAGAGTTGSSTVHGLLCNDFKNSIHFYGDCAGEDVFGDTVLTFRKLGQCAIQQKTSDNFFCNSTLLRQNLVSSTTNALLRFEAVGDTPMQWFAAMISSWVPELAIIITVRDPDDWVAKRRHFHSSHPDILCHPQYWDHPSLLHPFDIYACLKLDEDATKVLIDSNNIAVGDSRKYGEAFVVANIVNAHLVPRSRLLLINLFEDVQFKGYDREKTGTEELRRIRQFALNNKLFSWQ